MYFIRANQTNFQAPKDGIKHRYDSQQTCMFIEFQKVGDKERTWIACIIYKILPKMLEWLGQV